MMRNLAVRVLLVAGLLAGIHAESAGASTISVDPNPTDFFHIGNGFTISQAINDAYTFTLSKAATIGGPVTQIHVNAVLALYDDHNVDVGFLNPLQAGVNYILRVTGSASNDFVGPYYYAGTITFTAVAATPLPATALLFASALAGLGCVGIRRRRSIASVE
jgi:hypothetical protein